MIRKIVGAYTLLRSVTYILVTDTKSIISFPKTIDPHSAKNRVMLIGQRASIQYLIDGLEEMKEEHEKAIKELNKRK